MSLAKNLSGSSVTPAEHEQPVSTTSQSGPNGGLQSPRWSEWKTKNFWFGDYVRIQLPPLHQNARYLTIQPFSPSSLPFSPYRRSPSSSRVNYLEDYAALFLGFPFITKGRFKSVEPPFYAANSALPILLSILLGLQHALAMGELSLLTRAYFY